jgi:hypothetical protein
MKTLNPIICFLICVLLSCNGDTDKTPLAVKPDPGSTAEKKVWKEIFDKNEKRNEQIWRQLYATIDEPYIPDSKTEQYRLTVYHPYNIPPVMYRISKSGETYSLTRKEYLMVNPDGTGKDTLLYKSVTRLTKKDWLDFLNKLNKCNFRKMNSDNMDSYLDPLVLSLEGWNPIDGFNTVSKMIPAKKSLFTDACELLQVLAGDKKGLGYVSNKVTDPDLIMRLRNK